MFRNSVRRSLKCLSVAGVFGAIALFLLTHAFVPSAHAALQPTTGPEPLESVTYTKPQLDTLRRIATTVHIHGIGLPQKMVGGQSLRMASCDRNGVVRLDYDLMVVREAQYPMPIEGATARRPNIPVYGGQNGEWLRWQTRSGWQNVFAFERNGVYITIIPKRSVADWSVHTAAEIASSFKDVAFS